MPALTTVTLKSLIIDVVSSGDARLQSLLIANIDAMWALNNRHGYARMVQYLYTQADALRFGMEFFRTQIDEARTDSDSRASRNGSVANSRDFSAQHTETRNQLTLGSGTGTSSESHHSHMTGSVTGSESSNTLGDRSVVGQDHSATTYSANRATGEHGTSTTRDSTLFSDSKIERGGVTEINGTSIDSSSGGDTWATDANIKDFLVPVRFAYIDGNVTHQTHLFHSAGGNVTVSGDPVHYSEYSAGDNFLTVNDTNAVTQRGNLDGAFASEIGSESDSNTHNIIRSGHGQLDIGHSRSISRNSRTDITGASASASTELTSVDGRLSSLSHSLDTTHGETHDIGQSNAELLGTIDYFSQLFENLKMMYESVIAEIKITEQQIAPAARYVIQRLSVRYAALPPCGARSNNPVLRGVPNPFAWPRPN